ncbi:MAG TPA: transglycosylase domain-containing protein, partial [Egibacteraceae bacterium]|nr:transglycosylase domain-containing protein [Egibacteraceae bacterium]
MRVGIIAIVLVVLGLVGAVVAWFAAGPVIAMAARSVEVTGDPEIDLPGLQERSVVRAADGTPLAVLADEFDREVVELERIPEHVRQAVLVAEDRRFYEHDGYDVSAIFRAAFANLRAGGVEQGASTITQQLAQTNFLSGEETIRRKLEEVSVARALEDEYDKDELLERYLNQVYLGAGAYGFQAGAQEFFHVNVEDLQVEQAALLAGMIRSPSSLDPRRNPQGATSRRDVVLRGMASERYIDRRDADRLIATPIEVAPPRDRSPDQPYVVEAVKREFFNNPTFGETVEERVDLLFRGGLEVQTTVHPQLQQAADDIVSAAFPDPGGATAAIVAVHPVHGGITALHGGRDFNEVQFDLATQGRRQPGSALKPVTAASALEQGIPPTIRLEGNGPISIGYGGLEPFEADNFGGSNHGTVDLREALVSSVNTAFAQLIVRSGVEETIELGGQLGINIERAFGPENTWGPAIVLGGLTHGVTPLEMASVFAAFANEGISAQPYLIQRVADASGEILYEREPVAEQVLHPAVAAAMVDMLQDVVARGTGTGAQLPGVEPIGKTGTNADGADAWFVGAVPVLSTAVWVGHAEGQVPMPGMTGGSVPADLWRQFMQRALEGVDVPPFADNETDLDALPKPEPEADEDGGAGAPTPPSSSASGSGFGRA